jgi:peptidoglycan/LPS O-acetylase OafA/YrhL
MEKKAAYYPQLDSLRAFACFIVILFHSNLNTYLDLHHKFNPFKNGNYGVDLFFVLSGFLITSILVKQYVGTGKIIKFNFYMRRILRLYPPILIAVLIFLVPVLFIDKSFALSNMFFLMTYTGDCVMLFQHFFHSLKYPLFFGHAWSLAIEEQFYLIFPFLLTFTLNYYRKKEKKNVIGTFLLFNILFIIIMVGSTVILKQWFYKFFLWRFFQIFFGGYLALIFSDGFTATFGSSPLSTKIRNFVKAVYSNKYVVVLAVFLFLYMEAFYLPFNPYGLNYYFITILSSILIVNAVHPSSTFLTALLSNRVVIYLGRISYGLYLYHAPMFYLNTHYYFNIDTANSLFNTVALDIAVIATTILVSILSYELVEKRILAYKVKL